jgi:hypothetical protein
MKKISIQDRCYGIYSIPKEWIQKLVKPELLWKVIDELFN